LKNKILVTGPTSALASAFMNEIKDDYDVVTMGRRNSDIYCDFSENSIPDLPTDVDVVIHFAASIYKGQPISELFDVNVGGTIKLCEAIKKAGIKRFIYISSIYAKLDSDSPYYGYYSVTKKSAEEASALYCRMNGIQYCTVRPAQIIGADLRYAANQPLIYRFIECAKKNEDISIYGTNDALKNLIYDKNVINALKYIISEKLEGIYDIIDENNYSVSQIARVICDSFGSTSEISFIKDKPSIEDNAFYSDNFFLKHSISFIKLNEAMEEIARVL
jgi:nucleoside-diphosphate-sugar epimerase